MTILISPGPQWQCRTMCVVKLTQLKGLMRTLMFKKITCRPQGQQIKYLVRGRQVFLLCESCQVQNEGHHEERVTDEENHCWLLHEHLNSRQPDYNLLRDEACSCSYVILFNIQTVVKNKCTKTLLVFYSSLWGRKPWRCSIAQKEKDIIFSQVLQFLRYLVLKHYYVVTLAHVFISCFICREK